MASVPPVTHVILDRDGVLNHETDKPLVDPTSWRWLPGSREALALFTRAGVRVSIATNQAAVGRGDLTIEALRQIHGRMLDEAAAAGAVISSVFVCPHTSEAHCTCRKPAPGLIKDAVRVAGIPERQTRVIGDDARDMEASAAAGIEGLLVGTGKGTATASSAPFARHQVYSDLWAAARDLTERRDSPGARHEAMIIDRAFAEHLRVMSQASAALGPTLACAANMLCECLQRGHAVLACGNGGSAADADHLVAELVGRFHAERPALRAIALSTSGATVTALANDYGYAHVFRRQIEALAGPGDVLVAISTSGNSENVVEAARALRAKGGTVIALSGATGGRLASEADCLVLAPSITVARIQEVHGFCVHAMVETLEERLRA
jgi:histidinol-phosphate phosphatase family protein